MSNILQFATDWCNLEKALAHCERSRQLIISLICGEPEKLVKEWSHLLSVDRSCTAKMRKIVDEQACPGCRTFLPLAKMQQNGSGTLAVTLGRFNGWHFRIISLLAGKPYLSVQDNKTLISDGFTHFLLTQILWEAIAAEKGFPAAHILGAFICDNFGYLLREENHGKTELLPQIMQQLALQMKLLESEQLTLLEAPELQFREEAVSYNYNGRIYSFSFMVFITLPKGVILRYKGWTFRAKISLPPIHSNWEYLGQALGVKPWPALESLL